MSARYLSIRAFLVILTMLFVSIGFPAAAQEESEATGSLTLIDQTDWVTPDQPFFLDLRVSSSLPMDQVDLVVTVFSALNNRSSFIQSLNGKMPGSAVVLDRKPLTELVDPNGIARIFLPVSDRTQRNYFLKNDGVYPIRIELRETGTSRTIDQLVTHLIKQPSTTPLNNRLQVALTLPVAAPLAQESKDVLTLPDKGAGVGVVAGVLSANLETPVSLAVQPETVERLGSAKEGAAEVLDGLVSASSARTVLRSTWAPLPAGVFEGDMVSEANRQIDEGDSILSANFPLLDKSLFFATDPLDTNALNHLNSKGIRRLVIPEENLTNQSRDMTLARPFVVSLGKNKGNMTAVQADKGLADHFERNSEDPVLAAHHLLADLAVIWNDRPGQQREVVVMPSRDWIPSQQLLQATMRGLKTSPILNPVGIEQVFSVQPEGGASNPLVRQMNPRPKGTPTLQPSSEKIKENRSQLKGFSSMVTPDNALKDELERRLMYSMSSAFDSNTRTNQLEQFKVVLDKQLGSIHLPPNRSLQLTARKGEIPVSVQNDTGYSVLLIMKLESDKLQFPLGNEREITVGRQSITTPFAVDARTSGAFPVQIRLESPDGSLVLAKSRLVVRSTSVSGIGIVLSIGAGVFLFLWWARSFWRSHRHKRTPEPLMDEA